MCTCNNCTEYRAKIDALDGLPVTRMELPYNRNVGYPGARWIAQCPCGYIDGKHWWPLGPAIHYCTKAAAWQR